MSRISRGTWQAAGTMVVLVFVLGAVWLPTLPNELGHASADFGFWLPNLLAGYFWYLHNGLFSLPWFSPAQCAGEPFQADPQLGYLSIPQLLSFVTDPLSAVRLSFYAYGVAGYWGAWVLARQVFRASVPAALLAAGVFLLNGFFATRMVVGHLAFAPFMFLPAVCALILRPADLPPITWPALLLRVCLFGLLVGLILQSGMVVLLPQFLAAAVAVVLLHAVVFGFSRSTLMIGGAGLAVAMMLCAGKLTATAALLSHFPRQEYSLPGVPGPFATLYVAVRSLFWPFSTDMRQWVRNTHLIQDPHEFAYGVGLAPPLLLLAALGGTVWRGGWRALLPRRGLWAAALAVVLVAPIALNTYGPWWTAFLKTLPILKSSSTLLRWFAVPMLPATLGAALALDRLAPPHDAVASITGGAGQRAWMLAMGGLVLTVAGVVATDKTPYGSAGLGIYNPDDITRAWQAAHDSGTPLPIRAVGQLFNGDHRPLLIPDRGNGMAHGISVLSCYDPLFGYRLENMPFGKIHLGLAMSSPEGVLNFKNPACYVFPAANQCAPGDQFATAQAAALQKFLNYERYKFHKPLAARMADWLSLLTLLLVLPLMAWCGVRLRRPAGHGEAVVRSS
jgi:hypothetical protein